ncbi:MAG: transcriptional repressor LexA [Patescibacteria group bacterium]|mgnify:CR=1 FL=1
MTYVLPRKKRAILDFVKQYVEKHGFAPTLTEIAEHFGVSALSTIHEHMQYLEDMGFIRRDGRHVQIVDPRSMDAGEPYVEGASISLPLVGLITAGAPIEAVEDRTATLPVPRELVKSANSYILKVKGDSMIESLIADGDFVIVEKREYARDGDIVVAMLEDGTATLKQYFKEKNYIRLQPANKQYKPIKVKQVVIQGKVTGIIRKFAN